jgi:putative PIN family toxin of toxin-antitoxin system
MQRIVIDTNVLVSALIQKSYPYLIISNLFLNKNIEWCVSDEVLQEYHDVLKRNKFSKYPGFLSKAEALLATIETTAIKFIPKIKLQIISDYDDNIFLELAAESKADFLITGNTNDFTLNSYKQTKIVTPREFWEKYYLD